MNDTVDRIEKIYLYTNEVLKLFNSTKWDYVEDKKFDNPHIYIIEQELKGYRSDKFGGILRITNWELISSHSGRRSFIKNMIDVGTMDYKTIMSISGHRTMKEFEKYIGY